MPEEWKDFEKRHVLFFERFPHLDSALQTAFIRTVSLSEPIDKFVFQYGRLCVEDFFEVALCSGNGYGMAAQKLLRTLYERAVTLMYLNEHPDEVDAFIDFQRIQDYKVLKSIEETMGEGTISADTISEAKARCEEVKGKFMVDHCKACGTERLNHSWSKLNFVAMSKKTAGLNRLVVQGYYVPLKHAHATFGALSSRLEVTDDDTISFAPTAQRIPADGAFRVAHSVILQILLIHNQRFKVAGLEEKLQICMQDFLDTWGKKTADVPSSADDGKQTESG
jgi:hypothetical protein